MSSPLSPYHLGRTTCFACQADQRFSYCLYVPPTYAERPMPARLLVAIHGTERRNQWYRDLLADYAEATNTLVLAPLFPGGIADPDDLDHYKYLLHDGIRFDRILLAMVDEVARRYGIDAAKFLLFGFSGGAQLAHRFYYVHPERLDAVVIGAPGSVTLPTERHPWWAGLGDYAAIFGRPVPWDALRTVPIHLVAGALDTNPAGTVQSREHPKWVDGATAAGVTRVERLRALHAELRRCDMAVTHEELPGVQHQGEPIVRAAIRVFSRLSPPALVKEA